MVTAVWGSVFLISRGDSRMRSLVLVLGASRSRRLSCAQRCFLSGFRLNQRHPCMVEKGFSGRRQLNTVRATMHQLDADFLLEIADLPAERWLGSVQLLLGGNGQT